MVAGSSDAGRGVHVHSWLGDPRTLHETRVDGRDQMAIAPIDASRGVIEAVRVFDTGFDGIAGITRVS